MEETAEARSSALPKALVLSYVATVSTPTRVKRVAAVALFVIGVLNCLGGLAIAGFVLIWVRDRLAAGWTLEDIIERDPGRVAAVVGIALRLFPGVVQIAIARLVSRGDRFSSNLAIFTLVPLVLAGFFFTAVFTAVGVFEVTELFKPLSAPILALGLAAAPLGILGLLLLGDLRAYLAWIARNPTVEKPPVAFLPGKAVAERQEVSHP